ncbi:MAG: ATP-binding cassette domain-containing protein [Acidimicrobiia bacterium]|nr:ATP-binding cassette domain-containing protein [Acidimicrobiia bacterium]
MSKRYGDVVALDEASFEVPPGRIVGFLGRNGAGKTTTMRCVFGLATPDSGTISYDGTPVSQAIRRRFGYMPEERGLYPKMKVREQLIYFGRLSGLDTATASASADRWLGHLGLGDRADAKVEDLSHGNQQRVQLAVSIVHQPEVLVLDEPFAGLDPIGVTSLTEVLHEFADGGAAILFSSHQLELVEDVCDDIAIVDRGHVGVRGDLEELKRGADYRRLTVEVADRPWIPEDIALRTVTIGTATHAIVPTDVSVDDLLARARAEGPITRFSYETPGLTDLFREAVADA